MPLPVGPSWLTKESVIRWEREQAKTAHTTLVCLDISVATIVLDREALKRQLEIYIQLSALSYHRSQSG